MITEQRDGVAVFEILAKSLARGGIQYAIFTTYEQGQDSNTEDSVYIHLYMISTISEFLLDTRRKSPTAALNAQHIYADIWKKAHPETKIFFEPTIRGALRIARKIGEDHATVQTLVTGSQHLVGGFLPLIQPTNTCR
jgi:folylpolyglutamate synthase